MDRQLVDESGGQVGLPDRRAAHDGDVLVAGSLPRGGQGGFDALGDERVDTVIHGGLGHGTAHDEYGQTARTGRTVRVPVSDRVLVVAPPGDHRTERGPGPP